MTRKALLACLAGLRRGVASGGTRAPHKPLLLLWLFGQFATTGSSAADSWLALASPLRNGPPLGGAVVTVRLPLA